MRRVATGDVAYPEEQPLFDWREYLEDADAIIAELNKPIPAQIGSRRKKPSPGADLRGHRESLARFLAELAESHICACKDYEARNDPNKPPRELKDDSEPIDPTYDYGEDAGVGLDWTWEELWLETYSRGVGNPGKSRRNSPRHGKGPPVGPLRLNFPAIEHWWKDATGGGFSPKFAKTGAKDEAAEPFERNNPSARFLILVAQELDKRYVAANASGLVDTVKKQRSAERTRDLNNRPPDAGK